MIHTAKLKRGFTLIELLLFMALFTIILGILANLFTVIVDTQLELQSTSAVENDSKYIVSRFMYDIQRTDSITTPVNIGDSSPNLTLEIDGTTYTYNLVSGKLQLTVNSISDTMNSINTELSSLSFTRLGNIGGKNAIQVDFTVDSTNESAAGVETKNVSVVIGTR